VVPKRIIVRALNLGCGTRFHPDWVNLDIQPAAPEVKKWDLQMDFPFPEKSFDAVYHSHVLEHFSQADGLRLLQSCRRVLRQHGILRVAVPDLERIARAYLQAMEGCLAGDETWKKRYDWVLLEMYDQANRDAPGGEMMAYARQESLPDRDYVIERVGQEFHGMTSRPQHNNTGAARGRFAAMRDLLSRKLVRLFLGRDGIRAQDIGVFRTSGEVHRCMYDRYSLSRALAEAGFLSPRIVGAAESAIDGWANFHLDTEADGRVYKPDSLFMEATRA
jgi:predicted SAM-dependent methyltransferase